MTDDIVTTLRRAGRQRLKIDRQRSEASTALSAAVIAADAIGMAKTAIAEEAGVSRQTVHQILRYEVYGDRR